MSGGLLDALRKKNPDLVIADCADPSFAAFGRLIGGLDTANLISYMEAEAAIGEAVSYRRSVTGLEDLPGPFSANAAAKPGPAPTETWKQYLGRTVFGGIPVEMGWCVGKSRRMNALEYHKSSEVSIAGSDLLLLLGRVADIRDFRSYDADKVRAFLIREGQAIETWSTTLHFAPVTAREEGFRAAIVLPAETNAPLPAVDPEAEGEESLLWATNKWLIACPGSGPAAKGAVAGISRNIEVEI